MITPKTLIATFFGVAMVSCASNVAYNYGTEEHVRFTVSDKERIVESNDDDGVSSKYIVFTEEGEVFENTDSVLRFKFNSSTVQGQLKEGQIYDATVYGWRIPFLSTYRNIVSATPAN